MKSITTTFLLLICLNIQAQDLARIHAAINRLAVLEGQWEGSGWVTDPSGSRSEFRQTEVVERKLDGTTMLIQGAGYENDSLAFQAMAIASFNTETGKYRFTSFLADGKYTEAEGWFDEAEDFHWQFTVPNGGTVRYSLSIANNKWQEKGSYRPKGVEQWYPFMQMELTKLK